MGISTQVDVRVIAKDGKYLGDDIGGARVSIYDARTGELLAGGNTSGGSGLTNLMDISLTRAQILPVDEASVFTATLDLDRPRLIRVEAHGPLAAIGSANTVSQTQWVYPGKNITGGVKGGGLLLEIPGLIVQILDPPTHFLPTSAPKAIDLRANVTMMCGCPIGPNHAPWLPEQFDVTAVIEQGEDTPFEVTLEYDKHAPYAAPSQFTGRWTVPVNTSGQSQIYAITVSAFQQKTGNTGVAVATVIIPAASPAPPAPTYHTDGS
jgi:hypothetical protein